MQEAEDQEGVEDDEKRERGRERRARGRVTVSWVEPVHVGQSAQMESRHFSSFGQNSLKPDELGRAGLNAKR
jgi:hypothetical protein